MIGWEMVALQDRGAGSGVKGSCGMTASTNEYDSVS
jgi:hypothetical protein